MIYHDADDVPYGVEQTDFLPSELWTTVADFGLHAKFKEENIVLFPDRILTRKGVFAIESWERTPGDLCFDVRLVDSDMDVLLIGLGNDWLYAWSTR